MATKKICRACKRDLTDGASEDFNHMLQMCGLCARDLYDALDDEDEQINRAMTNAARMRDRGERATYCHGPF